MPNTTLRKKLDSIVNPQNEKNWYIPDLFECNTRKSLPKELHVVSAPPPVKENYNCFLFALNLYTSKRVVCETGGFLYSSFIRHLVSVGALQQLGTIQTNSIVLYRNTKGDFDEYTHAGIVQADGLVVSKWSWGPIIEHKLFDVPSAYGDTIDFFEPVQKNQALILYQRYNKFNHH